MHKQLRCPAGKPKRDVPQTQCGYCKKIFFIDEIGEHRLTCRVKYQGTNGKLRRCDSKSNRQASYQSHKYFESFYSKREEDENENNKGRGQR